MSNYEPEVQVVEIPEWDLDYEEVNQAVILTIDEIDRFIEEMESMDNG